MLVFKRINSVKIEYCNTDSYCEDILYKFYLDDKEILLSLYDWQDISLLLLKLYVKASNKENYRCFEELEGYSYLVFRIYNIENDKLIFQTWANAFGEEGAECIFNKADFVHMLENVFDSLLADTEYIKLITTHDYNDTPEEIEINKRLELEHLQMLKERVLYDYADQDIEDYNLDNPNNIFNRKNVRYPHP